jgi:outer membrane receptor for ferrienterochelin and colicin
VAVDSSFFLPAMKGGQSHRETVRRRFVTAFAEDSWKVLPNLFLEGALHFERAGYGDPGYSSREKRVSLWSPRAGVIWKPAPATAFRVAGARFLQATHFDPRLSMGEIGGFTLGENASFATLNTEFHLAWEQELGRSLFFSATAFHRERRNFCIEGRPPLYGFTWRSSLLSGLGLALNHLLSERTGLSLEYNFLAIRDREYQNLLQETFIPHRTRRDHEARLRLAWVHPVGLKMKAEEAFVIQRLGGGYGEPSPSAFWVTNLALAWEMPGKRGEVSLGAENLFDRRFRLLTRELVIEERLPVRRVILALRVNL